FERTPSARRRAAAFFHLSTGPSCPMLTRYTGLPCSERWLAVLRTREAPCLCIPPTPPSPPCCAPSPALTACPSPTSSPSRTSTPLVPLRGSPSGRPPTTSTHRP